MGITKLTPNAPLLNPRTYLQLVPLRCLLILSYGALELAGRGTKVPEAPAGTHPPARPLGRWPASPKLRRA